MQAAVAAVLKPQAEQAGLAAAVMAVGIVIMLALLARRILEAAAEAAL